MTFGPERLAMLRDLCENSPTAWPNMRGQIAELLDALEAANAETENLVPKLTATHREIERLRRIIEVARQASPTAVCHGEQIVSIQDEIHGR